MYDPQHLLSDETLRTYELSAGTYRPADAGPWPAVGLGLRLWEGTFEGVMDSWLRWCDASGKIIPTGEERAAEEAERARQLTDRVRELEAELRRLKGEPPAQTP